MKIAANRESWRNFGIFAPFCKKNGSSRIARKRSTIPPFLVLGAIYKNLAEKNSIFPLVPTYGDWMLFSKSWFIV